MKNEIVNKNKEMNVYVFYIKVLKLYTPNF